MSMPGGVRGGDREESPYSIFRAKSSLCANSEGLARRRRGSRRGGD
jgi:hypothetical protein